MRERGILRRSLGWLAGVLAAVLILLAVVVGLARLLLPLAPEYQDEIRRLVTEATGFDVQFRTLRASWPLTGPELRFGEVRIAMLADQRPVFDARELVVGLSLRRLVLDRQLQPGRIGVRGARVRAERLPTGQWLVNTVFLDDLLRRPRSPRLPRLDLRLRDIALEVADPARLEPLVAVTVRQLDVDLGPRIVGFTADVDGGADLGPDLELSGSVPAALLPTGRPPAADAAPVRIPWDVRLSGGDLNLARWLRILANEAVPLVTGRGEVELKGTFEGPVPLGIAVDLDLGPVELAGTTGPTEKLGGLDLAAAWQRDAAGWEATLDRFVLVREGRSPAPASGQLAWRAGDDGGPAALTATADRLRLQDLWPLVRSLAGRGLRETVLPERLEGEVSDFELQANLPRDRPPEWTVVAAVRDLGVTMPAPGWAVTGVSGSLRADQAGGVLDLASGAGLLRLPTLFRADIRTTGARGRAGWKLAADGLEVFGEDLRVSTPDVESRGSVRVRLPSSGPVFVDVNARFVASSAPSALNYLPLQRFRPNVVRWLDRALVAGSVPNAELLWQGPLRGFPYADGGGRFRAEFTLADAVIDYADDWPRIENATGTVIIDRATLSSVENRGAIGGLTFDDAEIRVPNLLRDAELDVRAADGLQMAPILAFLRQTPLARLLGPTLESVTGSGPVASDVNLRLPLARPKDYRLSGRFDLGGVRLGLRRVDFGLTALEGTVRLDGDRLAAERVAGRFLDEPVQLALRPARADEPGLVQVAEARGGTPAGKLAAAFSLPYAAELDGRVDWEATIALPARRTGAPVTVAIRSDLKQFVSRLPAPLAKAAGVAEPLDMEVQLPGPGEVSVSGAIDRGVSWALEFTAPAQRGQPRWRLARGELRSGGPRASLPGTPGLAIAGSFASLRFEDWFPARGSTTAAGAPPASGDLLNRIDLKAERFAILGRTFPATRISARRTGGEWQVAVRGPTAEGTITVPAGPGDEAPIVLDMDRLWLGDQAGNGTNGADAGDADPRKFPAVRATVRDFVLKDMQLGRLTAEVVQRGDGIVVEPLTMQGPDFRVTGDAAWVLEQDDPGRQRSELRLALTSTDIAPTLSALGYDPVVQGEKASVTLDLFWPGGPSDDFLNAAGGRVVVSLDKGRFLPVNPGGGRLVGLLSIAALPRRLGLDFSDVTDKGLAFDRVQGEFRLDRGNAFTCNLGLEGPATDIGILGRVSIPDRRYDQLAVVRPHVSDVLAVGGFVGGPVVGSTVLLISQIFRKPLSALGESYYRLTGPWDEPLVTEVQKSEVDLTPFRDCERYLAEALKQLPPEAELTR